MRELPHHVSAFKDRHGRTRYRFRKLGLPTHYFRARPGTEAFMEEWRGCLTGETQASPPPREARKPRPLKRTRRKPERIYFIAGRGGAIKIGYSRDPKARMRAHQTSHPEPLRLIATVHGGRDLEAEYHRRFAEHRVNGEWFKPAPELLAEIRQIIAASG